MAKKTKPDISREAITTRFLRAVDYVIMNKSQGCKNYTNVANAIGMPQQNFTSYRNGTQYVTIEQLAKFCTVFNINPEYILLSKGQLHEATRMDQLEQRLSDLEKRAKK